MKKVINEFIKCGLEVETANAGSRKHTKYGQNKKRTRFNHKKSLLRMYHLMNSTTEPLSWIRTPINRP